MSCEQTTFSLMLVKMPTEKRLKSQTKEIVVIAYDYFEELSRCKQTQGPLKRKADATGLSRASIKVSKRESRHWFSFFVKRFFFKTTVAL